MVLAMEAWDTSALASAARSRATTSDVLAARGRPRLPGCVSTSK
jgi:hypothetical protein